MDKARIESLKNLIKYVKPSAGKVRWNKIISSIDKAVFYVTGFKPENCKRTFDGYYHLKLDVALSTLTVHIRKHGAIVFGFESEEIKLINQLCEEIKEELEVDKSRNDNDLLAKINVDLADLKMSSDWGDNYGRW